MLWRRKATRTSPIEAIFQEIIDRNQRRSFTAVSVLPFLSTVASHRVQWNSRKLAEISHRQRNEYTRVRVSFFSKFISCYTPKIRDYKPLWQPVAWVCAFQNSKLWRLHEPKCANLICSLFGLYRRFARRSGKEIFQVDYSFLQNKREWAIDLSF